MGLLDQVLGAALGGRQAGGGGPSRSGGGMNPILMAIVALLAQKAMGGRNAAGGGLGGMLGGLLGGGKGGGLGGLLQGGAADNSAGASLPGGLLAGGLGGLLEQFQRSGHGDIANSWVGTGDNRSIAPDQLADALGPETVDQLSEQTGMPQQDLLSQLSQALPNVVDQLTPNGRLPSDDELNHY